MDENKKRIIFIIGFVFMTLVLGYALYKVFFQKGTQEEPPVNLGLIEQGAFPSSGQTTTTNGRVVPGTGVLPSSQESVSTNILTQKDRLLQESPTLQVTEERINNVALGANGNVSFYSPQDGKFYRLQDDGTIQSISDKIFYNVDKVTWAKKDDEAILQYPDGSNIYYNFDTQEQATLPKYWDDFSFSAKGDQIAAKSLGFSPENRWLVASSPNGKNTKFIEPLGDNADEVIVNWSPNEQVLAFSKTGQDLGSDRQEILFVGANQENFNSTVVEGRGFEPLWSPSGEKLLYSVYSANSQFKPELWIVNGAPGSIGSGRKALKINTWANKCAFENERFIYCAVPVSLDQGAGFEPSIADNISDQVFKIDTQTGVKTEIPIDGYHTIDTLIIDKQHKQIFFTDKVNSGLFKIPL
ncbi:MAG: hypothetical protein COV59_04215 [Candidatus Magasanikbacteria bacterium CG11_big_fil_rev_8_21_14_0_20_39_34]|uniref:Dipeptidylpeptidase IV N-terminal domain-containing protein n=1 Tax=Candidatus Magasanikbacteria bacterium CG11_big_fil_rev_8_21_14_0_20_39_34 TaxID=1974653 RepID=A0A2H0N4M3_9BACT|nr:MAG: hypothetical protein COV59_04215 [Candidatus Magasanikbacteria bacterium CG11_big_fil_rev_8_21_14_0_20_39_34]